MLPKGLLSSPPSRPLSLPIPFLLSFPRLLDRLGLLGEVQVFGQGRAEWGMSEWKRVWKVVWLWFGFGLPPSAILYEQFVFLFSGLTSGHQPPSCCPKGYAGERL